MSALKSRLAKLENRSGDGRWITVRSSDPFTKEEVNAFLVEKGVNPTREDRILHYRTTMERAEDNLPDEGPNPWVVSGLHLVMVRAVNAADGLAAE